MIPTLPTAMDAAMRSLRPGGCLYVVDFGGQTTLPGWLAGTLRWWLAGYHVYHQPELLANLQSL